MKKNYEFLNKINFPSDLKKIPESKLQKVADELVKKNIEEIKIIYKNLDNLEIETFKINNE